MKKEKVSQKTETLFFALTPIKNQKSTILCFTRHIYYQFAKNHF